MAVTYKWAKYNKNFVTNTSIIHAKPEHYTAYLDEYYDRVGDNVESFTFYANEEDFKRGKTTTLRLTLRGLMMRKCLRVFTTKLWLDL